MEVMEDQQQECDHCYQQVDELTEQLRGDEASVHVVNADCLLPRPRTIPVAAVRGDNGAFCAEFRLNY